MNLISASNMGLHYQFQLLQAMRNFFAQENFTDVLTPPMVENPGIETHIHPFALYSPHQKKLTGQYLHTSPEFYMKYLLSQGMEKIFTLCYAFRDEPSSPIHRNQFLMLEWYRAKATYFKIMEDAEALIRFCHQELESQGLSMLTQFSEISLQKITIQELFFEYLNFDILKFLEKEDLQQKISHDFPDVPLPTSHSSIMLWEDYFFLLFLNKIEPHLANHPFLLLYEYPKDLCALATIKQSDPRVCERFEIYIRGIELANCYNELTDRRVQEQRYLHNSHLKDTLYQYQLPIPNVLLNALETGLPPCSGIALGVERLLFSLVKVDNPFFT